jgi:hypothetical protein
VVHLIQNVMSKSRSVFYAGKQVDVFAIGKRK